MTTNNYTPINFHAAANAATINAPLAELDAAIGEPVLTLATIAKTLVGSNNEIVARISNSLDTNGNLLPGLFGGGGVINTGSTFIGADSVVRGVGEIALQTRGVTRLTIDNAGSILIAPAINSVPSDFSWPFRLDTVFTTTGGDSSIRNFYVSTTSQGADHISTLASMYAQTFYQSTGTATHVLGVVGRAYHQGVGLVSVLAGTYGSFGTSGAGGTVTQACSFYGAAGEVTDGTITNAYGLLVTEPTVEAPGSVVNNYGVFIGGMTVGTSINYGLYITYTGGFVGIYNESLMSQIALATFTQGITNNGTLTQNGALIQAGNATFTNPAKMSMVNKTLTGNNNKTQERKMHLALMTTDVMAVDVGPALGFGGISHSDGVSRMLYGAISGRNQLADGTCSGYLSFMTGLGGNGLVERVRINNVGSVMIGTVTDGMTAAGSLAIAQDLAHRGTKAGFYNGTPRVRGAALTAQLTTITFTAPGTPDYAIQDFTQTTPWGFASHDEANSHLAVIANLQVRCAQLEARLGSATGVNLFA